MKTIEPFINLGWWTVPLLGELKRLPDGTKTIPKFQEGWKERYLNERNLTCTRIGGVLTGSKSGIIAIDCDNTAVFNLFRGLDPDYDFVFASKGKGKLAGTIIYAYSADLPPNFGLKNDTIELDFYGEEGFVYLPTKDNESKEPFNKIPELKAVPEAVLTLLKQFYLLYQNKKAPAEQVDKTSKTASYLAPIVEEFVRKGQFIPGLFKIITPKDFRTEPEYVKKGYLHPDNVPDGRGSEYLSKISAIFGADPSIDEELYVNAMHAINNTFSNPMDKARMDKTICDPMIAQKVEIDGVTVWNHDKHWASSRLVVRTKRQNAVELAYDDIRRAYYIIDVQNERVDLFSSDNELQMHLDTVLSLPMTKKELKAKMPIISVASNPSMDFGFTEGEDPVVRNFNAFIQTPELRIINNPEVYKEFYNEPKTLLQFLETLVPEEKMRTFLLGFLKRKFTTFDYSPTVLYFLGVHGSGKDTLVEILETIMGSMARPKAREFIEKHNGWILDSYFAQLDEFGNQLNRSSEQEEALGLIKAISGKPKISIRMMRTDSMDYYHKLSLIMTANKNPLMLEDGDRRMAFMHTPNVLSTQEWVADAGGIVVVREKIMAEIKDFCYYLATQVANISSDVYVTPPYSKHKHKIIADSMYAANRIAYACKHGMQDYLIDLAEEYECKQAADSFRRANVTLDDLEPLYDELTENKGDMRILNKAMRSSGIDLIPTTSNGEKTFRYKLNWSNNSSFGDSDDDAEEF